MLSNARIFLFCLVYLECFEYQVLVDMVRVPDWAFEAAGQEMRGMGQDAAAYQPGLYLTAAQVMYRVKKTHGNDFILIFCCIKAFKGWYYYW